MEVPITEFASELHAWLNKLYTNCLEPRKKCFKLDSEKWN